MQQRSSRIAVIFSVGAVLAVVAVAGIWVWTPSVPRYRAIEGQPLLEQDGPTFVDRQLGIRFTPPAGWALQIRSTEAPGKQLTERKLAKYKRLIKGVREAWLRVNVAEVSENTSPGDVLRQRKPREVAWTVTKDVEEPLQVGGRPAARVTFTGQLTLDKKGPQPSTSEVVAVRNGPRMYFFDGTFANADVEARKSIRAAIESIAFD